VDRLIEDLRAIVGSDGVLAEPDELLVYECDGLPQHKLLPRAIVFPRSTEETAEAIRVITQANVSFAPRGAGTGLSGGALPTSRGVVIEMAGMRRLLKLDAENRTAIVETGFVNAQLSRAAAPFNLYYAPDPSSQATCTIGGNIAENAGGIHCLKYGMTVDHVLAARIVLADGQILDLGSNTGETPGYDLLGLFVGSEGTFGIATEATLRLLPAPPAVRTLLADFTDVNDASRAVSAIIAAGLIPAALEMIDGATIRAVEASVFAAGIPLDAEAALLIELDGLEAGLDAEAAQAETLCRIYGARAVRRARDEHERKKLWAARKGAFGAMGRLAPDLMLQDAVVPRSRLPEVLAETYRIGAKYRLLVANVFHAGDGNLHPFICFDSRRRDEVKRVKEAGREIMETCVRAGGTITGEHGVGLDKSAYLPLIFTADDMDAMLRVRAAFDPTGLCNPGKIIPVARSCGEARAAQAKTLKQLTDNSSLLINDSSAPLETTLHSKNARDSVETSFATVALTQSHAALAPQHHQSFNSVAAHHHQLAQIVGAAHVCEDFAPHALAVAPANTQEACELLRFASRENLLVTPAGAGTWLETNNASSRAGIIITTRRMTRVIEHEPADLTATVEAGVSLAALNDELKRANQWLPLDPPDDGRASLGGIAATGCGGAQNFGDQRPRCYVIGMRVALADGRMLKAGGRVVKNVAGYDLCKLFVGSYGTLGLILELTFKLRPLPAQTITIVAAGSLAEVSACARRVLDARLFPVAIELLSQRMAEQIGAPVHDEACALLVRHAGNAETVAYQAAQTHALFRDALPDKSIVSCSEDEALWRNMAAMPLRYSNQLICRANVRPTELYVFLNAIAQKESSEVFDAFTLWHAGALDGRVRVIASQQFDAHACAPSLQHLREAARDGGGTLILENASPELKSAFNARDIPSNIASLNRSIKQQLDPKNLFSTGHVFTNS
jgi:glycolate oxidase subunit GlcD